jgi:5-hydroxyisourate hydrolase-like protein (transthyretin family)
MGWANWGLKEDKKDVEIKLTEPKELAGIVVDENDKPVEDAVVNIYRMYRGEGENRQYFMNFGNKDLLLARTDSEGKFVFPNIPEDARAESIIVKKTGRAIVEDTWRTGFETQYRPGQEDIKISQPIESKIEGQVVEKEGGKPAAGVNIAIVRGVNGVPVYGLEPVVSGEDGSFSIAELPADTYLLVLAAKDDGPAEWVAEPVTVETETGKTVSGIKIEVSKGGMAKIVVTEAETKKPREGAVVYLNSTTNNRIVSSGISDKDGIARIRLLPGEYRLAGAYKIGLSSRLGGSQEQIFTIEEGETERLEIQVQLTGPSKITGVVRDKEGKALEGVKLKIVPLGRRDLVSDSAGKYEMEWQPDRWGGERPITYLIARDEKNNLAEAIEINEETRELEIKLKEGVTITGRIVDTDKKPITEAGVIVAFRAGNYSSYLNPAKGEKVDAEGRFEIKALPAEHQYELIASADGYGIIRSRE